MQTKKITFFHLKELINISNTYVDSLEGKKNALSVRIEKIAISLKKALMEYNSMVEDIRADHCSIDKDGNMIIKEGTKGEDRYTFKPKELKDMRALIKALDDESVSIDINITANVPNGLTYAEAKYFRGILIPEDYIYTDESIDE